VEFSIAQYSNLGPAKVWLCCPLFKGKYFILIFILCPTILDCWDRCSQQDYTSICKRRFSFSIWYRQPWIFYFLFPLVNYCNSIVILEILVFNSMWLLDVDGSFIYIEVFLYRNP
jgi:hypothetical protein